MPAPDVTRLVERQRASYRAAGAGVRGSWPEGSAMDGPALAAFLGGHRYGVLATGRPDGRPQAAPIAYFLAGGDVWFATVAGARLRNVRRVPYAAFVVSVGEGDDHRAVLIEGGVTVHEPTAELRDRWRDWHGSAPDWAVAFLRLEPERVLSFTARAPEA